MNVITKLGKEYMVVDEVKSLSSKNMQSSVDRMKELEHFSIACNNWSDDYPYTPQVTFAIAHNGPELFIHFQVCEHSTMAQVDEDNGKVSGDSCVEFFFSLDERGYYNFEFNCIGRMLLAFRKIRTESERAPLELMQQVIRYSTLGRSTFDERCGEIEWELTVAIPISLLFKHNLQSWSGIRGRANLYKCGDNLSKPHYLSWHPITNDTPNFHLERCFESFLLR